MSVIEKLTKEMLKCPVDFRISDLDKVMNSLGYRSYNASGGSGIKYFRERDKSIVNFHLPHGANAEKAIPKYVLKQIIDELKKKGDVK